MNRILNNQKQSWQALRKKPGLIFTITATMGMTTGALLCVLTLAYVLLVQPLPYPDQHRLYKVNPQITTEGSNKTISAWAYPAMVEFYKSQQVLEQSAMLSFGEDVLINHPAQPTLHTGYATPEWFDMVGAPMAMGRSFDDTQGVDKHVPVAVISFRVWQDVFAADPQIIGKQMDFSGVSFKVIGVMAKSFIDPQLYRTGIKTDVWLPWDYNLSSWLARNWQRLSGQFMLVGKKPADKSDNAVANVIEQQLTQLWQPNTTGSDRFKGARFGIELVSFKSHILGDIAGAILLLLAGAAGLMLIATVNVANVLMSRTAEQHRTLAIRAALGASPGRLFYTLLGESAQLMLFSIVLALPMAAFGFSVLQQWMAGIFPRVDEVTLGPITILFALIVVVAFALCFAWLGSRTINYRELNRTLQSSGKGTGVQVSRKMRATLIFSQVALASSLIFVNGVLFSDAYKILQKPSGFNIDNMLRLNLSFNQAQWPGDNELKPIMADLQTRLEQLPQVERVVRSYSPLSRFSVNNFREESSGERFFVRYQTVSRDYFDMIGQPVLEGELFGELDQKSYAPRIVINDELAKAMAKDGSAVGMKLLGRRNRAYTVVAVVKSVTMPGQTKPEYRAYVPASLGLGSAIIKLKPGQKLTSEQVVSVLTDVDPRFSVGRLDDLAQLKFERLFPQYMTTVVTAVLALLSLFIAAVGLYGIVSYSTQLRRTEIGTRMAIGATKGMLIKLLLKDNAKPVCWGLGFGLLLLVAIYALKADVLGAYLGIDSVLVYVLTLASISVITFIACYLPLAQYVNKPAIHALRGQ